jgi:hypothetical protein
MRFRVFAINPELQFSKFKRYWSKILSYNGDYDLSFPSFSIDDAAVLTFFCNLPLLSSYLEYFIVGIDILENSSLSFRHFSFGDLSEQVRLVFAAERFILSSRSHISWRLFSFKLQYLCGLIPTSWIVCNFGKSLLL